MVVHYIATVGTNINVSPVLWAKFSEPPIEEVTDPICFGLFDSIIRHPGEFKEPLRVTLIHSDDSRSIRNACRVKENLHDALKDIDLVQVPPFDKDGVVHAVTRWVLEGQKTFLNVTSGTNPMHVGMWLAGINFIQQKKPVKIVYIKEFRSTKTGGKGDSTTMQASEVNTDLVLVHGYINQGHEAFDSGNYLMASEFFSMAEPAYDSVLSLKAQAMKSLSLCNANWEEFNHVQVNGNGKTAHGYLLEAISYFERIRYEDSTAAGWLPLLEEKSEFLGKTLVPYLESFKSGQGPHVPPAAHLFHAVDVFESACWKLYQGKYMDAIVRAYRSVEMLLEYHAWVTYNVRTSKADLSFLDEDQRTIFRETLEAQTRAEVKLTAEDFEEYTDLYSKELLALFKATGDTLYSLVDDNLLSFKKGQKKLDLFVDYLRVRRNSSYLSHGIGAYTGSSKKQIAGMAEPRVLKTAIIKIENLLRSYLKDEADKYFRLVQRNLLRIDLRQINV